MLFQQQSLLLLPSLMWGSTVGYPSDSLASCLYFSVLPTCARLAITHRFWIHAELFSIVSHRIGDDTASWCHSSKHSRLTPTVAIGLWIGYSYWASECPDVKNYKWRFNPVRHRLCTVVHGGRNNAQCQPATVDVLHVQCIRLSIPA